MTMSSRFGLVGIAALSVLSGGHWLRAWLEGGDGALGYLLGVLPNLAAALAIPCVALSFWADRSPGDSAAVRRAASWMVGGSAVGLAGWECVQLTSQTLRFDLHDLLWTGLGSALAWVIARRFARRL